MAIEDAVEHIQSWKGFGSVSAEYNVVSGGAIGGPDASRHDADYWQGSSSDYFGKSGLTPRTARYWQFALYYSSHTANTILLQALEGATVQFRLFVLGTSMTIAVQRGTTTVATSTEAIQTGRWYWFQVWYSCADAGGRIVVKVDHTTTLVDFTGDTRNGGTAGTPDAWRLGEQSGGAAATVRITDLVVMNGDHADAGFLPDCRVDSLFPDGDGDSLQGVPSTGTTHYTLVDEEGAPVTTDYVDLQAVNDDDLYTLPSLPAGGGTVYGVAAVSHMAKTDAGTCTAENQIKASGGTISNGADNALATNALNYFDWFPDVPGGAGWTESDVNGLQVGVNRVA